ncbi:MAG: hypothetical protein M1820_006685 [Bogoriella megaspora]|nr:MAG: hypothetical protein M1820_006685 [Bogoriella megaspora]
MPGPNHSGYIDPNWPSPNGPHDASIIIYGYVPNIVLCILAIALFTLAAIVHLISAIHYRTWSFLPLTFACVMEVVGYIARTFSSKKDPYNINYFIIAYFFIVTAPVFVTASIYVCLNKIIAWAAFEGYEVDARRWIKPKLILWGFLSFDIGTTILQIAGASLIGVRTSNHEDSTGANNILLAGLIVQSIAFFTFLSVFFILTASLMRDSRFGVGLRGKKPFMLALGSASLLVFLRLLFRVAETADGVYGSLSSNEAYFGPLEFAPMVLAVLLLALWHPGKWVPAPLVSRRRRPSGVNRNAEAVELKSQD